MKPKKVKQFILRKPNQTIEITNGNITATQRKAYNVLQYQAQEELRKDKNKTKFTIAISEIKNKAGIQDTSSYEAHLKTELKALESVVVDCTNDESENWVAFTLLSQIKKIDNTLEFAFPPIITEALLKHDRYASIDIANIAGLQSKYAVIIYELAMMYRNVEIPKYTIEDFKNLLGAQNYKDFRNLRIRCIEPALKEINEKTDILMTYDYKSYMIGKRVTAVKLHHRQKNGIALLPPVEKEQNLELFSEPSQAFDEEAEKMMKECGGKVAKTSIKNLLEKYGTEFAKKIILRAIQPDVENPNAYIQKALTDDFAATDRETQEQQDRLKKENAAKAWEIEEQQKKEEQVKELRFEQDLLVEYESEIVFMGLPDVDQQKLEPEISTLISEKHYNHQMAIAQVIARDYTAQLRARNSDILPETIERWTKQYQNI